MNNLDPDIIIEHAKDVIETEADAVRGLLRSLGDDFVKACEICISCRGRIVVTGMGKSGHIAGKIAAAGG